MSFKLLPLLLLIGASACSTDAEVEPLQVAIDRQLSTNAQRYGIAGQAVLILHNGEPVYRGAQGLANLDTKRPVMADDMFPAFSLSKLFASTLIMQLVERGELDLDAPVGHYLPHLPERWHTIKVNDFLNHVSGIPEYFDGSHRRAALPETRDAVFKTLADKPLLFARGTETRYTQTNFLVLGAILEAHYAQPYRQIVTTRIIEPLGLTNTQFGTNHVGTRAVVQSYIGANHQLVTEEAIDWREHSIVHADLYITIDDLGRFLNALCAGRLVKQATLQRLWKPHRLPNGDIGWFAGGWEYGMDDGFQSVGHDGGTRVRARLMFKGSFTENTYAVIYFTNGSAENVWSRTLVESVARIALSQR